MKDILPVQKIIDRITDEMKDELERIRELFFK